MGVHFTRPQKMASQGLLASHVLRVNTGRQFAIYERRQCEENWLEYLAGAAGRPRTAISSRLEMLRLLDHEYRPRIAVDDAICTYEAAELLGCFHTLVPRLALQCKIIGRRLISRRADESRLWIFSRKSCLANASRYDSDMATGRRVGRPRTHPHSGNRGNCFDYLFNESMYGQHGEHLQSPLNEQDSSQLAGDGTGDSRLIDRSGEYERVRKTQLDARQYWVAPFNAC
jgi:hypothetical protein